MNNRDLFDEANVLLVASQLVYSLATLVQGVRDGTVKAEFPDGFIEKYKNNRLDLRGTNGKNGLSSSQVIKIIRDNQAVVDELLKKKQQPFVKNIFPVLEAAEAELPGDGIFLETFSSLTSDVQCVYGVVKNLDKKCIYIVFRGSQTLTDWLYNISAQLTELQTPNLIKDRMKGPAQEHVKVHRGFYEYLFDNKAASGKQRYDLIEDDIKDFAKEGYKIYVSGHSLGAALATMVAFRLAGSKTDWITKPIRCITYASPFVGASDFQTAFTELEKMGLVKYLRITNENDPVPTIPFYSLGWRKSLYKHVGINLRLEGKTYLFSHPWEGGWFWRALRNSIFKPFWRIMTYHMLPYYDNLLEMHRDEFSRKTIDELYYDEKLVGKNFLEGDLA